MPTTINNGSSPSLEEEGRFGFGTTPFMETLLQEIGSKPDDEYAILINVGTLVRNRYNQEQKQRTIADLTIQTIQDIKRELSLLLSQGTKQKHLLFYTMFYQKQLSKINYRLESIQRAQVTAILQLIKSLLPDYREKDGMLEIGILHFIGVLPSFQVLRKIITESPLIHPNVKLISHIPLDYHLLHFTKGEIIKSFKGDVLKCNAMTLGGYVFKRLIPFTMDTHLLLGDTELVSCKVTPKQKRELEELCVEEKWKLRTDVYIRESLLKHGFEIPKL